MNTEQKRLDGKGTVEDFKRGERMFEALAEMLFRPMVFHPAWMDSVTTEQKKRIKLARLEQIAKANGEKIMEATDYEALVYIMTASMSAPLGRVWQKIQYHLFKKFYPDNSDFIPDYEANAFLEDRYAQSELLRLKRWLYKSSMK